MAMCKFKDCQHEKESPIKDWKHRCQFGPDGERLQPGTVIVGWNDMATTHKEVSSLAHGWDPQEFTAGSKKKKTWKCSECGVVSESVICNVVRGSRCRRCSDKRNAVRLKDRAVKRNCFADKCKHLLVEVDGWDPFSRGAGSKAKVGWKCRHCGHKWKAVIKNRANGAGCIKCGRSSSTKKRVELAAKKNSLAERCPHLISEANGWSAFDFAYMSNAKKDWKCSNCGLEWIAQISSRAKGSGCPGCNTGGGHDQTKESFVYLIYRPGQIQYGIMNIWTDRLKRHARKGWELLDKIEVTGRKARSLETKIKQTLRANRVPTGRKAFRSKFEGYSETFQEVDLYVRTIRGFCRKLGINLEAFLAA